VEQHTLLEHAYFQNEFSAIFHHLLTLIFIADRNILLQLHLTLNCTKKLSFLILCYILNIKNINEYYKFLYKPFLRKLTKVSFQLHIRYGLHGAETKQNSICQTTFSLKPSSTNSNKKQLIAFED
jgi:hypothetical protein